MFCCVFVATLLHPGAFPDDHMDAEDKLGSSDYKAKPTTPTIIGASDMTILRPHYTNTEAETRDDVSSWGFKTLTRDSAAS